MAYGIDHIRFKINKEGNRFMVETLKGIILRETPIGDYDKMMTVLTADGGKLSVFAKGAKRLKSPLFAATQLFSYTEMTLKKTGNTYYIRTGDLIENFYHIRDTLEGAALAGYIADIASDIAIEGQEAVELMRLVLNSFHLISTGKKPIVQIKAVFELRAAAIAGFMPNLVACDGCGNSDLDVFYFDVSSGTFRCEDCYRVSAMLSERFAERRNENEGKRKTYFPALSPI
jgi:DNA repair protein RecO (recombination protein O)